MFVYGKFTNHPVSETDIDTRTQHEFSFTSMGAIFKYSYQIKVISYKYKNQIQHTIGDLYTYHPTV